MLFIGASPRLTLAQYDTYNRSFSECGQDNILHRSALERNLKVVLNSLVENVGETGYNISSYGENGDKIYGLVQCRGDLNASACQTCTSRAGDSLCQIYNGTYGSIHLGICFLKYATHNPDSSLSSFGNFSGLYNESKSENAGGFSWRIANLLTGLVEKTESSMVGYSTLSDYGVYSLAECWRDLARSRCSQCLNTIYTHLNVCSVGTNKGTIMNGYCMIQFTEHKFYSDHVPLLSPPNGPSPETEDGLMKLIADKQKWSLPELQLKNLHQKRKIVELEDEIKKLSGQQNLQQRIHQPH